MTAKRGERNVTTFVMGKARREGSEERVTACEYCEEPFRYMHHGTGEQNRKYCSQRCRSLAMNAEGRRNPNTGKRMERPKIPVRLNLSPGPRETPAAGEARWKQRLRERREKSVPDRGRQTATEGI